MRYVKQLQRSGCGIATLAMLLDREYQDVLKDFPQKTEHSKWKDERGVEHTSSHTYNDFDSERGGLCYQDLEAYLAEQGYAVMRRYRRQAWNCQQRAEWPPKPFGPMHFCDVVATTRSHFVVMLDTGEVYDPWFGTGRKLTDYKEVYGVAAVFNTSRAILTP